MAEQRILKSKLAQWLQPPHILPSLVLSVFLKSRVNSRRRLSVCVQDA